MIAAERHRLVTTVSIAVVAFMCAPLVILFGVALNDGPTQSFPPHGLSLRWFFNIFSRDAFLDAIPFSLELAVIATVVSLAISTLASIAIVRFRFPGRDLLLTLLMSPLIVPQVVVGMAFLVTLSALGIFNSIVSLSLLHCVITLPFALRVVVAALQVHPASIEEAAQSLGASPVRAFFGVTVPQIAPGLLAAGVFAFVTSFENFTASQFLVWDRTTLPIAIYTSVQTENDPTAAALSSLIVAAVIVFIAVFNRFVVRHMLAGRT
jgi:putative spermidine/putrescine transport system permease protein